MRKSREVRHEPLLRGYLRGLPSIDVLNVVTFVDPQADVNLVSKGRCYPSYNGNIGICRYALDNDLNGNEES